MRRITLALALSAAFAAPVLAAGYQEAPELAALVQQGKLPPVAQRLPQQPQIVQPTESIGRYGGVLRTALRGDNDQNSILRLVGPQGLTRWTPDNAGVAPNLAEGWTRSADATEYTFKLRPGTRWSDGQPFTADDILFSVNDLLLNKEFFASPPSQYVVNDKPMRAEKVDDFTVKLILGGPSLRFPELLATPLGQHSVLYQKRYCQQFTPQYNPGVTALLAESRQPDWASLLRQRCGDIENAARWANPARPTLDPWVVQTPYTGGGTQVVLQRNPYFWQVDPEGKQLPYVGTVNLKVISNIESIMLAAIGGQLDLMVRHINLIGNKPVLAEHAEQGRYVLQPLTSTQAAALVIYVNQTSRNSKLRPLLQNRDFRAALSLGMDREEINDIVFLGQSTPWQTSPHETDKFYNRQLALQYTEHDLAQANRLLDGLGLTKRDGAGFRLLPDGSRLFLTADASVSDAGAGDVLELLKKHWAEIGVDLGINNIERSLFYDRAQNNDYDLAIAAAPGGLDPTSDPRLWLSTHTLDSRQSLPWVRWYASGGRSGEEPSESMKRRLALWDEWKQASDPARADELFRQILQMAADAFEVLGTERGLTTFGVRSKALTNVPASMPNSWTYPTPAPTLPQQYYFAR